MTNKHAPLFRMTPVVYRPFLLSSVHTIAILMRHYYPSLRFLMLNLLKVLGVFVATVTKLVTSVPKMVYLRL